MVRKQLNRRSFLEASTVVGTVGLAGCTSGSWSSGGSNGDSGGNYPSKPITVVVPWSQGGGTDRSTRAVTPVWSNKISGDFVVQNYSGAGTQIGGEKIYNAKPDGYTVGMWNLPQMQATWLLQDAPYTASDFDFIGTNHADPTMWFAPKNSPYKNFEEFVSYAEKKGSDVVVGLTSTVGNTALSGLVVRKELDLDYKIVNLEGGSGVRKAVLAGDVDAAINEPWAFNPTNIGKVTPLGTHTKKPQDLWPDTPAFWDLGFKKLPYVEPVARQWKLMVAPGGLKDKNPDRYQKLVDTYKSTMNADKYMKKVKGLSGLNKLVEYNSPKETKKIVQENTKYMKKYKQLYSKI
ncbi:hypothetical protein DMJ13_26600 [halophilic archaeon]|nr:hypothetical protein DMJ13_26600 [halophilic archaeon]